MNKGTAIGLGVLGVGAVGALAWYLYNKNKSQTLVTESTTTTTTIAPSSAAAAPSGASSAQASATPSSGVTQTMWKDKDGNIFKLITSSEDKYGYLLQVNGSGNAKAVSVELGSDGYIYTQNKIGEKWMYKGKWNRLSGLGRLSGIGNAYALN